MKLIENVLYQEDLDYVSNIDIPWEKLKDSCVLLSGATGQFGSFFIDVLMKKNSLGHNCKIYAIGRNKRKFDIRFSHYSDCAMLHFIEHDINNSLNLPEIENNVYVLHLASNTHPIQYANDPIGTINTNIIGLKNMLDFAVDHKAKRFIFASSNEIYGENIGDVDKFNEDYCGYINCNTVRAGYPESKRCGEALCQAYLCQKELDIAIPRFTRSFGPTLLSSDTKASSQFIHNGISGNDIVLKSKGTQYYSYTYTADAISGLLYVLLKGRIGEAYNIATESCDIKLKDLAKIVAENCKTKVIFEIPDAKEAIGYSKATKARLDGGKLEKLGWSAKYDIHEAVKRTISILKSIDL